ncbi:hypothetical protein P7C71_g6066, partial [Lecanoromycetidae sp. Uapishka_2]
MAKATQDRQSADAAASARDMQEGVVQKASADDDVSGQKKSFTSSASNAASEITRRDVHTASSINAQRRFPKFTAKEPSLVHQANLNRANGQDVARSSPIDSSSTDYSKPVLVHKSSNKTEMRRKPTSHAANGSPKLPNLESFSFQDILASIGPEADASIDAIAEICGRSKMSLAEEHGSHMPPQGNVRIARENSPADSVPPVRLETVDETRSRRPHTRSKSRSLALASTTEVRDAVAGDAIAAMSNVTSHTHTNNEGRGDSVASSAAGQGYLLPHILGWLRGSNTATSGDASQTDGAARALHNLLNDSASIHL